MADPVLSVVICTLDRAELLRGCLAAVMDDVPSDGSVEVLVVDNGSTDHTRAVVASFAHAAEEGDRDPRGLQAIERTTDRSQPQLVLHPQAAAETHRQLPARRRSSAPFTIDRY